MVVDVAVVESVTFSPKLSVRCDGRKIPWRFAVLFHPCLGNPSEDHVIYTVRGRMGTRTVADKFNLCLGYL